MNFVNCSASLLGGALLFFLISNLGVWLMGGYEKSIPGLITCYMMAIPFFQNTLSGSVFYSAVMYGGYEGLKYFLRDSILDSI